MAGRRSARLLAAVVLAILLVGAARRRFSVIKVVGRSMEPTLHEGERLLLLRTAHLSVGDVVVVRGPVTMIKRVTRVDHASADTGQGGHTRVFLAGDNPAESWDSRQLGAFDVADILGRIVWPSPRPAPG
jgi:signal peptidase I